MVSFAPAFSAVGAAAAVRPRNAGTVNPQLTSEPVATEVFKKSRRVGVMIISS